MNLFPLTPPTASHPHHVVTVHYYLAVDGPAYQVVRAPAVPGLAPLLDLIQVAEARQNGRALPYLAESVIVQNNFRTTSTPDNGVHAASPPSSSPPAIPPPRCRCAISALSIVQGAVTEQHVASTPSRSKAASAAPAC